MVIALVGQASAHIGYPIFRQRSHLMATLNVEDGVMMPKGQTITHIQQAMQVGS
jgi:hypothetical protein